MNHIAQFQNTQRFIKENAEKKTKAKEQKPVAKKKPKTKAKVEL